MRDTSADLLGAQRYSSSDLERDRQRPRAPRGIATRPAVGVLLARALAERLGADSRR
jgi:hypothetical protein